MKSTRRDYELLGIAPGASPEQVRTRWLDLVKQSHPDRVPPAEVASATARVQALNDAYARICAAPLPDDTPGWAISPLADFLGGLRSRD